MGGGKQGIFGDWSGFASGAIDKLSLRLKFSGLGFAGKGPGEFGGRP